jgi:S1-C subfamily serine protease
MALRTSVAALALLLAAAAIPPPAVAQRATMTKLQAATSLAPMLARVMPGVVSILVTGERQSPVTITAANADAMMAQPMAMEPFRSGGSGVVVDAAKGLIVTNDHVIADATRIDVVLADGRLAEAKLVGTDGGTDVAVIRIDLDNLTAVRIGDSDKLRIGDFIAAVGNPFGLEGSASQGIVSAKGRSDIGYEMFEDFLQIDAAVNPGNSGGALVDIEGRLVGINTATGAAKLRTQGIAFAIPINLAMAVANELIANGRFKRGSVGCETADLSFPDARRLELPDSVNRGALITKIISGSPAAKAGAKVGDVIVAIGGRPVRGHTDYVSRVATTPIGRAIEIDVVSKGGAMRRKTVTVADLTIEPEPETAPMGVKSLAGLTLGAVLPGFKAFGEVQGARVLEVTGAVAKTGLARDDVIVKVDTATVRTPDDVFEAAATKMSRYRFEIYRGGKLAWVWVEGT